MKASSPIAMAVVAVAAACTALAGTPVQALRQVHEEREADPGAVIEVANVSGRLTIKGWDRKALEVTGTLGDEVERLEISGNAQRLEVRVILPKRSIRGDCDADLELHLPRAADLELSTVSADITVSDFAGELQAESVSGDVGVAGQMKGIEIEVVSGEVTLAGQAPKVHIEAISSDVHLEHLAPEPRTELAVETVSGDIIVSGTLAGCELESVSGDLLFDGDLVADGVYDLTSHSGDVHLLLQADADARFDLSTFSGELTGTLVTEMTERRHSRSAPGEELDFTLGAGRARVRVETFSGDVEIERR